MLYILLNYRPSRVAIRQCTSPLTGGAVPFKLLRKKDKDLIRPRHLLYHLGTDFANYLTLVYTGKIACKYVFEVVFLVAHRADDVFVHNVGYEVCLHSPRIDYFFIVLADVYSS